MSINICASYMYSNLVIGTYDDTKKIFKNKKIKTN